MLNDDNVDDDAKGFYLVVLRNSGEGFEKFAITVGGPNRGAQ